MNRDIAGTAHQVMEGFEYSLRALTLAPYIVKAMALIGVKRLGGSNMSSL